MKILWISQNLPYPPKTGVLQRNYNLINQASKFATVDLIAIVKNDILPGFSEEVAARELRKICRRVEAVRLPIESSRARFGFVVLKSLATRNPFTVNWASSDLLRGAVQRAVARDKYDIVYFDTISLAQYRSLAAGMPRVLNHHNIESHLLERRLGYERHPLKRFYFGLEAAKLRRYEASVALDYDAHLVVSALDGERLSGISPGVTTAVVANGVDTDYFRPSGGDPEPGHLLMVSGMNWFPNRDAVLLMVQRIWPALIRERPQTRLTIVGASPPQPVLDLAARDSRVQVTGFVDDVRPYMEAAEVYLCPMRDGGGTRLKILDALSMGKAIVATTMALEGIAVEPETHVIVADSPDDFVTQILRVIDDPTLARRLGVAGREFASRNFSWTVIGDRMEAAFAAILRGKAAAHAG